MRILSLPLAFSAACSADGQRLDAGAEKTVKKIYNLLIISVNNYLFFALIG